MKISSNKATHACGVPVVRCRSSAHNARRLSPAVVARASSETAASTSSGTSAAEDNSDPTGTWRDKVRDGAVAFAATAAVALSLAGPAAAIGPDPRAIETGKCLLSQCQKELAGCLADEKCDESLVCLQGCFGKPDEADCQVKCGDLYASKAIQTFNTCAVSQANCVKQKQDDGSYPVPPVESMAARVRRQHLRGQSGRALVHRRGSE
jgi:violaxanthin de-epoxidase